MYCFEYECDRCGAVGSYAHAIGYYRLADGTEIFRTNQPVWCRNCDALCAAEFLPEIEHLSEFLATLESDGLTQHDKETAALLRKDEDAYLLEKLQHWRLQLHWREARQSPPRCLECESTDIVSLAPDPNDSLGSFEHPKCGGSFTTTRAYHASQGSYVLLDSEGRKLK